MHVLRAYDSVLSGLCLGQTKFRTNSMSYKSQLLDSECVYRLEFEIVFWRHFRGSVGAGVFDRHEPWPRSTVQYPALKSIHIKIDPLRRQLGGRAAAEQWDWLGARAALVRLGESAVRELTGSVLHNVLRASLLL